MRRESGKGKGRAKKDAGSAAGTPRPTGGVRMKLDGYAHAIPGEGYDQPAKGRQEPLIGGVVMDLSGKCAICASGRNR